MSSPNFLHIMKIWNIGSHLQFVSCFFVDGSANEGTLKKVAEKNNSRNYLHFLRSVKKHPTLTKQYDQTNGATLDYVVSVERQCPNLSFGTPESDICPVVGL